MENKPSITVTMINDDFTNPIWEAKYTNVSDDIVEKTKATGSNPVEAVTKLQENLWRYSRQTMKKINKINRQLQKDLGNFFWWLY